MKKGTRRKAGGPTAGSLRDIPSVDFTLAKVRVRRNPYAARIAAEGITVHLGRGRPAEGAETGPTVPRSVRFPAGVWKELEQKAKADGMPLHAALRAAVLAWLNGERSTSKPSR